MEIILAANTIEDLALYAGKLSFCKIGLPLIADSSSAAIWLARDMGYENVLYDGKFNDIPSVVEEAVKTLVDHLDYEKSVWGFTVHVAGGIAMLKAAKDAAGDMKVIGVLKLTSLEADPEETNYLLGQCRPWVDGFVCTVREAGFVKSKAPNKLVLCPGVRFKRVSADHVRVSTFREAASSTADYLIVGRPLTLAEDPDETLGQIKETLRMQDHERAP